MNDEKTHIQIQFVNESGDHQTEYYAVGSSTLQQFQAWLRQQSSPGRDSPEANLLAMEKRNWLYNHGAELDRADGPARVDRGPDGSCLEVWYRNGKQHRENGPAQIMVNSDGSRWEEWYRDGKLHRNGGPADILIEADGTRYQDWYRDGELIQKVAPFKTGLRKRLRAVPQP